MPAVDISIVWLHRNSCPSVWIRTWAYKICNSHLKFLARVILTVFGQNRSRKGSRSPYATVRSSYQPRFNNPIIIAESQSRFRTDNPDGYIIDVSSVKQLVLHNVSFYFFSGFVLNYASRRGVHKAINLSSDCVPIMKGIAHLEIVLGRSAGFSFFWNVIAKSGRVPLFSTPQTHLSVLKRVFCVSHGSRVAKNKSTSTRDTGDWVIVCTESHMFHSPDI